MDQLLFLIKSLVFVDAEYQLRIIFAHSSKYMPPSPLEHSHIPIFTSFLQVWRHTIHCYVFYFEKRCLSSQVAYSLSLPSALLVPPEEMHGKWEMEILERSFNFGDLRVCQMIP